MKSKFTMKSLGIVWSAMLKLLLSGFTLRCMEGATIKFEFKQVHSMRSETTTVGEKKN